MSTAARSSSIVRSLSGNRWSAKSKYSFELKRKLGPIIASLPFGSRAFRNCDRYRYTWSGVGRCSKKFDTKIRSKYSFGKSTSVMSPNRVVMPLGHDFLWSSKSHAQRSDADEATMNSPKPAAGSSTFLDFRVCVQSISWLSPKLQPSFLGLTIET